MTAGPAELPAVRRRLAPRVTAGVLAGLVPLLADKELPTFKFALEKSTGKVIGGSFGKEATVLQLPISKGIAGVSMRLEPGAMRELHWHATAAEWAFVIEGRVRTTVIEPVETYLYRPARATWLWLAAGAKRLQSGRLEAYVGYMLVTLLVLLAIVAIMK